MPGNDRAIMSRVIPAILIIVLSPLSLWWGYQLGISNTRKGIWSELRRVEMTAKEGDTDASRLIDAIHKYKDRFIGEDAKDAFSGIGD